MCSIRKARSTLLGFLSAGLCLISSHAMAAPMTIDSFATNHSALALTFPPAGTSAGSSASGAGILGAERDMEIYLSSGVIAGNGLDAVVSSGFMSYSQDATIAGTLECQWDGADGSSALNPTGLGGIDLTGGGAQDAIQLNLSFDDLPAETTWTVYSDGGNASSVTFTLPGLIFGNTRFVIPFSAFTPILGAGADFSDVGAITLTAGSSSAAPDLVIDDVQTAATLNAPMTVALFNDVGGDGMANPGDTLRYTVRIDNPNDGFDAAATGVNFSLGAGPDASLVSGSVTTTQGIVTNGNGGGEQSVGVSVGTVTDGGSVTITFDFLINDVLGESVQQLVRQGQVTSDTLITTTDDPALGSSNDPTIIALFASPSLSATMSDALGTDVNHDGKLNPGDSLVYTVRVTNSGDRAAAGLVFAATLDANLTLVPGSVSTSAGSVMVGNGGSDSAVRVALAPLAGGGAEATITFEARLPASAQRPASGSVLTSGMITDAGELMLQTDDPGTAAPLDPTATEVVIPADPMAPSAEEAPAEEGDGSRPGLFGGGFSCAMGGGSRSPSPLSPLLFMVALGALARRRRFCKTEAA
jgi:uncharacterized repeat protein (TIGR01451 family)